MLNDPMTARERPAAAVQAVDTARRSVVNARISDLSGPLH